MQIEAKNLNFPKIYALYLLFYMLNMNFKKILLILSSVCVSAAAFAQFEYNPREHSNGGKSWINSGSRENGYPWSGAGKSGGDESGSGGGSSSGGGCNATTHGIKLNLPALALNNISLQYEFKFANKLSICLGGRFTIPDSKIAVNDQIKDQYKTRPDVQKFLANMKLNSLSFAPEIRYYLGRCPGKGFYLGVLGKYDDYSISTLAQYKSTVTGITTNMDFKGNSKFTGGGGCMGVQLQLGKHICLDWWLAGVMYGKRTLDLVATSTNFGFVAQDLVNISQENPIKDLEPILGQIARITNNQEVSYRTSANLPAYRSGFCLGFTF